MNDDQQTEHSTKTTSQFSILFILALVALAPISYRFLESTQFSGDYYTDPLIDGARSWAYALSLALGISAIFQLPRDRSNIGNWIGIATASTILWVAVMHLLFLQKTNMLDRDVLVPLNQPQSPFPEFYSTACFAIVASLFLILLVPVIIYRAKPIVLAAFVMTSLIFTLQGLKLAMYGRFPSELFAVYKLVGRWETPLCLAGITCISLIGFHDRDHCWSVGHTAGICFLTIPIACQFYEWYHSFI